MNDSDPAATYERLRIETAEMLRLNANSASLIEGLQVDLVALLRVEIDALQGQVLNGELVDLGRLASALTMLRSLLPEKALVSAPPPAEVRFGPDHQKRLREMIERVVLTPSAAEHEDIAARQWKDEQMSLAAASDSWTWQPAPVGLAVVSSPAADGRAQDGGSPSPASPAAPVASSPPQQTIPRENKPSNPPPGPREPWRDFVTSEGIVAPYFKPYG